MPMPVAMTRIGRVLNPALIPLARRVPPLAVIHHTGRRSGRSYQAPVQAYRTPHGFVIALVYGSGVDWLRNVEAASGAGLERAGRHYRLGTPRRLSASDGAGLLPGWARAMLAPARVTEYLELSLAEEPT